MNAKLKTFKDQSQEFELLTNEQEWFYRLHKDLQKAFPKLHNLSVQIDYLHWWKEHRAISSDSIPGLRIDNSTDLNLIGFFKGDVGIGEFARDAADAISLSGLRSSIINIPYPDPARNTITKYEKQLQSELQANVSIYFMPATEQFSLAYRWPSDRLTVPYSIGYWPWELDIWPSRYQFCFDIVDEIWGMSKFVCESFKRSNSNAHVHWMPLSVNPPALPESRTSQLLDVPDNKFVVLTAFDFNSAIDRKNPMASYATFKKVFAGDANAIFVVKCMGDAHTAAEVDFLTALKNDPQVLIVSQNLSNPVFMQLIRRADCFISLHRAEGFGRMMAEAMVLGTPVVATKYSGNLDFMNESNSYLVDYTLIPVAQGAYPLATDESRWADPSVEHAALQLRNLYSNVEERKTKIELGKSTILRDFSLVSVGQRMLSRLNEIKSSMNSI